MVFAIQPPKTIGFHIILEVFFAKTIGFHIIFMVFYAKTIGFYSKNLIFAQLLVFFFFLANLSPWGNPGGL